MAGSEGSDEVKPSALTAVCSTDKEHLQQGPQTKARYISPIHFALIHDEVMKYLSR